MSSYSFEEGQSFYPFHSADGNSICNWRQNYANSWRRPICKEYSSGGNCRGFSGSPTKDASTLRYGELSYIPPSTAGSSMITVVNSTDQYLQLEFRNRIGRSTPPLLPQTTTQISIPQYSAPELALFKTSKLLPGLHGRPPKQYKSSYTQLSPGSSYDIMLCGDRLIVNEPWRRKI